MEIISDLSIMYNCSAVLTHSYAKEKALPISDDYECIFSDLQVYFVTVFLIFLQVCFA